VREVETEATLHATLENALDVPHTAYLHRGLFRGGKRHEISATVRRSGDRVEAQYDGEPRPSGIAGRVLSPGGGTVEHWDRFILPSIAQVEYRLGTDVHFLVTSLCTPVSDFRTRMFAVVEFKTRFPALAVQRLLEPFALRIFGQDAEILRAQADNIRRFGGEQFVREGEGQWPAKSIHIHSTARTPSWRESARRSATATESIRHSSGSPGSRCRC
jgi:hypothetical protein